MRFERILDIDPPIDCVWTLLHGLEGVAGCVPGGSAKADGINLCETTMANIWMSLRFAE